MASFKKLTEGLDILKKYLDAGDEGELDAQHDEISALTGSEKEYSPEDKAKLESIGWHFNQEYSCWTMFT